MEKSIFSASTLPPGGASGPDDVYLSLAGDLYEYPYGQSSERCLGPAKQFLDLSPLAGFMGRGREGWMLGVDLDGERLELAFIPNGVWVGVVFKEYRPEEAAWFITYERSDVGLCRHGYRSGKANRMYGFPDDPFTPIPEEK